MKKLLTLIGSVMLVGRVPINTVSCIYTGPGPWEPDQAEGWRSKGLIFLESHLRDKEFDNIEDFALYININLEEYYQSEGLTRGEDIYFNVDIVNKKDDYEKISKVESGESQRF
ncbi:hypothetical protein SSABA_v1c03720 [Spiroplasma sabaudiense Ar-1343]|uniref:Uncharacterized protein n=1 Tax=Spiroplasma sabaudiense Ar-1343 TaxID=1276257 RepID=W6A9X4_9MOLU|nr:hypothetical protein [Spiroplasma sabaudiense]AHI53781.1 hypothetical protein SSABA_v1c03720 [Spiroplasma sabaudiense Ar-1343]